MVYGGTINSFMGFTNRTDQQKGNGMDGAHLRTPELICPSCGKQLLKVAGNCPLQGSMSIR